MNIRTFKSDKQALIDEGKRLVSLTDDAKFLRKVTLVNLMLNGATASSLSPSCGETARTLSNWIAIVDEQGFEALRPKKQPGRPFRLTPSQKEIIKDALLLPPEESGYTVWDGPSLSDYISKRFHVTLGVRQCQRLFYEFGFSLIRPQSFPSKDHEEDSRRDEFKKTENTGRGPGCVSGVPGRSSFYCRSHNYKAMVS